MAAPWGALHGGGTQESSPPGQFCCPQALWAVFWPWRNLSPSLKWGMEEGTLLKSLCPTLSSSGWG